MPKSYGIVYCARSPGGKRYIGQTTQGLAKRRREHNSDARHPKLYFHKALNQYGDAMVWTILAWCSTKTLLDFAEKYYIAKYETMDKDKGYNLTEGGAKGKPSEETRQKLSERGKGRKHPPEVKRRQSTSLKTYYDTPEGQQNKVEKSGQAKKQYDAPGAAGHGITALLAHRQTEQGKIDHAKAVAAAHTPEVNEERTKNLKAFYATPEGEKNRAEKAERMRAYNLRGKGTR